MSVSFRHRIATIAVAGAAAGGLLVAPSADAEPVEPVNVRASERYWACIAVDHVEVGTCLENPLPDLNDHGSLPAIVGGLLGR